MKPSPPAIIHLSLVLLLSAALVTSSPQKHKGRRGAGNEKGKADRWVWGTETEGVAQEQLVRVLEKKSESTQRRRVVPQWQIWDQIGETTSSSRYRTELIQNYRTQIQTRRQANKIENIFFEDYYSLICLTRLVSTVITWVQWWALWPCKPSRGDHPEVRLVQKKTERRQKSNRKLEWPMRQTSERSYCLESIF